jgi:hypothetical protein
LASVKTTPLIAAGAYSPALIVAEDPDDKVTGAAPAEDTPLLGRVAEVPAGEKLSPEAPTTWTV